VGHQHDLQAVAQLAVLGRAGQPLEAVGLRLRQLDANHDVLLRAFDEHLLAF
jgi:hypothetical protein